MRHLVSIAALAAVLSVPATAQLRTRTIASGLGGALYLTHAGDSGQMFVVQQSGTIRVIRDGRVLPVPFLSIGSRIRSGGERGLLGLAFPADYATSGEFYVSYTRAGDAASIIERYRVSTANPDVADVNSGQVVYGPVRQPFSNHNGGCIQFGPDGYLYFGAGDGGSGGDPGCRAQDGLNELGKMIRLDVSTTPASAPASNPFVGNPSVSDRVWATGVRNPWRFSFDRQTGDMWMADVGQNALEEINFQPASSTGGENYGWKIMEGTRCFSTSGCPSTVLRCNDPQLTDPIHTYAHTIGRSITGGYVYRGCAIPSLQGLYWYGDFASGRTWTLERLPTGGVRVTERTSQIGSQSSLASFGEDADGELYTVSLSGVIRRIEATTTTANDLGFGTNGVSGIPACSVCGLLTQGESAEFRLDRAAPNAAAALLVGNVNNPTAIAPWGTVVPNPWTDTFGFMTDAQGRVRFTLPGGQGVATAYIQFAVADPAGPAGVALSNALQVFFR